MNATPLCRLSKSCSIVLLLLVPSSVAGWQEPGGEPVEIKLERPTRIDWTFTLNRSSMAQPPAEWTDDYPDEPTCQVYVPASYDPEQPTGLILFVSPTPRAMGVQTRWRPVCDETGFILAAPHGSGNACPTPIRTQIVLAALDEMRQTYNIDPDRTYISGFSGGGRMACRIGFSIPEYFGGVMPIGSGGELRPEETWLKQRVADRLGCAFMIGAEDFNFCEIMTLRAPLLDYAGVRTRTWVVDDMGHSIPESDTLLDGIRWLDETAEQRKKLAEKQPSTRFAGDLTPPSRETHARMFFDEAIELLNNGDRRFEGHMLMKGIIMRWLDTDVAVEAGEVLKTDLSWKREESEYLLQYAIRRCRGLDRFAFEETHEMYLSQRVPRAQRAIRDWGTIIRNGADPEVAAEARTRIDALREYLEQVLEEERQAAAGDGESGSSDDGR